MAEYANEVNHERNWASKPKVQIKEEDLWMMLDIVAEVEPLELRTKLFWVVKSYRERMKLQDAYDREQCEKQRTECAVSDLIERECLKNELAKNKTQYDALQRENEGLRKELHRSRGAVARPTADEAPESAPRKRCRPVRFEDDDPDYHHHPPNKRVKSATNGLSRERIKTVLGGLDRGWGSMLCAGGTEYTYHVILDMAHFPGQRPLQGKGITQAVFGFDQDQGIISEGIVFPLFVRRLREKRSPFDYFGNYVAIESKPVAWKELSKEEQDCTMETIVRRSTKRALANKKRIRRNFAEGVHDIPCCRLEFRHFDKGLDIEIQNAPGRPRT